MKTALLLLLAWNAQGAELLKCTVKGGTLTLSSEKEATFKDCKLRMSVLDNSIRERFALSFSAPRCPGVSSPLHLQGRWLGDKLESHLQWREAQQPEPCVGQPSSRAELEAMLKKAANRG